MKHFKISSISVLGFFCVKETNGSFQFFSAVPSIAIHLVIISLFDIFHMSEFDVLHLFVEFTPIA